VVEAGVGETRAALIDRDRIIEARILPEGELVAGTILEVRLVARMPERGQGVVEWPGGEALVVPLPPGVPQGALTLVEITRPATPEPGKPKRARARPAPPGTVAGAPPAPFADFAPRLLPRHGPDILAAAGWAELLEEAATGAVAFTGGALSIHLTPAMTLIDVDGTLAPASLAIAGARAAAQAIRRLDITGSIGIDLPDAGDKAARLAGAAAIDDALPQPFERTAVNGFGFVQIVRRRSRRSLPELYAADPVLAHARALLRVAERTPGAGDRTLTAHPALTAALAARPDWLAALAQRIGAPVGLRADPGLPISGGHVHAQHP
jgi:hypothetical protein